MIDIFRDPLWQFVGVILAILEIVVSIILFFVQRNRKALVYEIVSRTLVLSAAEEVAGQLQILFQGKPVQKVHLIVIKLLNNGNVPITSIDYERQVSFSFGKKAYILTADISETNPSNLEAEIGIQDQSIKLKPTLLNSSDSITIKTLVSDFGEELLIDGRIVGVHNIVKRTDNSNTWGAAIMLLGMILLGVAAATGGLRKEFNPFTFENPITSISFILGYIALLVGMISTQAYRKRCKIFNEHFTRFVKGISG